MSKQSRLNKAKQERDKAKADPGSAQQSSSDVQQQDRRQEQLQQRGGDREQVRRDTSDRQGS